MDMLPKTTLSEEQGQNQYLADVAQENADGQTRSETALDPNTLETRERWNTQWAKDEVTGEQGFMGDERSCFLTWDDTDCAWQSRPFKGRQMKRRKGKGKGKGQGRSKRTGRAFFGDEQVQDPEWWSEEDFDGLQKGGFRPYQPDNGAGKDFQPKTKAEERISKEKAKKEPSLNPHCQPQKHPMKKDMAAPGNKTICLPVIGLTVPGLQMLGGSAQRLILHGWWQLR